MTGSSAASAASEPLPLAVDLTGHRVVLVGGGDVAARKLRRLLAAGARVEVVAPQADEAVVRQAASGTVTWRRRPYNPGDLDGAVLVVAATGDADVNDAVAADAAVAAVLCVRADDHDGSASFAAAVTRGPLQLAVSTGGASPALAARLRRELAERYGPEWGELAELLGELRDDPQVQTALAGLDADERARRWRAVVEADTLLYKIRTGNRAHAREVAVKCLCSPAD